MGKKRVVSISLVLFLVLAASSLAFSFDATIEETQKSTIEGESAVYVLELSHDSGVPERFDLYSPDVEWDITTDVLRPIEIQPGETKTIKVSALPLYATPGYYAITLHIRHSSSGDLKRLPIIIGVQPKDYVPGQYVPAVSIEPSIDDLIDPREKVIITVNVRNRNARDLEQVTYKLRSNLINEERTEPLNGLEEKQVVFALDVPDLTPPQDDILEITALVKDGEKFVPFTAEPLSYEIVEYGGIEHTVVADKGFLKTDWTYTLENTGNIQKSKEFTLKSNFFQSWFSTFEPLSRKVANQDGTFAAWDIDLDVGESTIIKVSTNYRPLLLVILVIITGVGAYYFFRSPLVVRKSAVVIAADEGGMSELKVLIEVSNRSTKPVKHVEVLDKVPHIATVVREFELGTIRPVKINHTEKKGTLIKWVLDELDGGEERVITYRIRSKLSILGSMRLPIGVTKFKTKSGRERSIKSNISQIGFGQ
jgi:hypothetical protein